MFSEKEEVAIDNLILKKEKDVIKLDNNVKINEDSILINNKMIPTDTEEFNVLMGIYKTASQQVLKLLGGIKIEYNNLYQRNIIDHTTSRIKSPQSIINKMKKKNIELSYINLIEDINDIAGVRVICPIKDDIYTMVKIIKKVPNWKVIKEKDYIKKPKKSGYSGYHVIVEVPVKIKDIAEKEIMVKVEIQLRTMAMDFWATNEHRMKYKTNKKLSYFDSKKLAIYARILNILDSKFLKIMKKQEIN